MTDIKDLCITMLFNGTAVKVNCESVEEALVTLRTLSKVNLNTCKMDPAPVFAKKTHKEVRYLGYTCLGKHTGPCNPIGGICTSEGCPPNY